MSASEPLLGVALALAAPLVEAVGVGWPEARLEERLEARVNVGMALLDSLPDVLLDAWEGQADPLVEAAVGQALSLPARGSTAWRAARALAWCRARREVSSGVSETNT